MSSGSANNKSPICHKCLGDKFLKERVRQQGTVELCHFCGARAKCIAVEILADWVGNALDENYELGLSWPYYDGDSDSISHYEQEGSGLDDIVSEIIEAEPPIIDAVINELTALSYIEIKDGGEPRYDSEANYVEKSVSTYEVEWEWKQFRHELRHRSRFFNSDAKAFLDRLMQDINNLRASGKGRNSVIRTISPDDTTVYYRARRADSSYVLKLIMESPREQLGPPPPETAAAGRMNAEGISVFYGAMDLTTCVTELRPSIGSTVVSAEFKLLKPIRVLDFQLLEECYHEQPLSYFQPDFSEKMSYRKFLSRLHSKIRLPILPGNENEYLVTQVLAEYMATIIHPRIDGVIFSSVQHQDGLNLVLFGHILDIQLNSDRESIMGHNSSLKLREDSVRVHRIKTINYEFDKHNLKDIDVERFYRSDEYLDYDDDW